MADSEDVERLASEFHRRYEELAPEFGYETREATAVPWAEVPEDNANLMRSVAGSLIADGVVAVLEQAPDPEPLSAGDKVVMSKTCDVIDPTNSESLAGQEAIVVADHPGLVPSAPEFVKVKLDENGVTMQVPATDVRAA